MIGFAEYESFAVGEVQADSSAECGDKGRSEPATEHMKKRNGEIFCMDEYSKHRFGLGVRIKRYSTDDPHTVGAHQNEVAEEGQGRFSRYLGLPNGIKI